MTIAAHDYDARYYGMDGQKANYRDYGPDSVPHWSRPLAEWIRQHARGPVLDLGAAYGHLVRDLNQLDVPAIGVEWSTWAYEHRVSPHMIQMDVREYVADGAGDGVYTTIVSLDFLEHLTPEEGAILIEKITYWEADTHIHVIGAHNPDEPIEVHTSDPTHVNHEPLAWYHAQYARWGWEIDDERTALIREVPAWRDTDWRDRIVVYRRQPWTADREGDE